MIYLITLYLGQGSDTLVKVVFFNLIRSKYKVEEEFVVAGTINSIIGEILKRHPQMKESDFKTCVVFHNGKPIHHHRFDYVIQDEEEIIITHFVGGG